MRFSRLTVMVEPHNEPALAFFTRIGLIQMHCEKSAIAQNMGRMAFHLKEAA